MAIIENLNSYLIYVLCVRCVCHFPLATSAVFGDILLRGSAGKALKFAILVCKVCVFFPNYYLYRTFSIRRLVFSSLVKQTVGN